METVNQRLIQYVKFRNIQNKDIQKALFIKSKSQVSNWLTNKEEIPERYWIKILMIYTDLNANWLLRGEGKMLIEGAKPNSDGKFWHPVSLNEDNLSVKLYSCQDCLLRERIIRSHEETIKSLESAIAAKDDLIIELQKKARNCDSEHEVSMDKLTSRVT